MRLPLLWQESKSFSIQKLCFNTNGSPWIQWQSKTRVFCVSEQTEKLILKKGSCFGTYRETKKKRYGKIVAEQKWHNLLLNADLSGGCLSDVYPWEESTLLCKLRLSWIRISVKDPRQNFWFISLCQRKQQLLVQHTKSFPVDFRLLLVGSLKSENLWAVQGAPEPIQPLLGPAPAGSKAQPCSLLAPDLWFWPIILVASVEGTKTNRTNWSPTPTLLCWFPTDTLNMLRVSPVF